jgi:hypothetical protein
MENVTNEELIKKFEGISSIFIPIKFKLTQSDFKNTPGLGHIKVVTDVREALNMDAAVEFESDLFLAGDGDKVWVKSREFPEKVLPVKPGEIISLMQGGKPTMTKDDFQNFIRMLKGGEEDINMIKELITTFDFNTSYMYLYIIVKRLYGKRAVNNYGKNMHLLLGYLGFKTGVSTTDISYSSFAFLSYDLNYLIHDFYKKLNEDDFYIYYEYILDNFESSSGLKINNFVIRNIQGVDSYEFKRKN